MNEERQKIRLRHLEERRLLRTTAILKNIHQIGVQSRTFMLTEHDLMLKDIIAGSGKYSHYQLETREWLESLIYLELLERICYLIEDFAKILNGLNNDLSKFVENLIYGKKTETLLSSLKFADWSRILHYAELDSLPISVEDKSFLKEIRERNIRYFQIITKFCLDFLELHDIFFNKFKHGNSIIYGMKKVEIRGEPSFLIPAVYNRRQPDQMKAIAISGNIYDKWKGFHDSLVTLIKGLTERAIAFIERDCVPFAEYDSYCGLNQKEVKRTKMIVETCDLSVDRITIASSIELSADEEALEKFNALYRRYDDLVDSVKANIGNQDQNSKSKEKTN